MALKPIYGKSPLTYLTRLALRPGRVRIADEKLTALLNLLSAHPERVETLEPAFRITALLTDHAEDSASAKNIRDAVGQLDASDDLDHIVPVLKACWALYEYTTDAELLTAMLGVCAGLSADLEHVLDSRMVRTANADLMAVLVDLYRVTGKKGILKLCDRIRTAGMDWTSVLHTFAVSRPFEKTVSIEDVKAGMLEENGNAEGFYTRQVITMDGKMLADGARGAQIASVFSGNRMESTAAMTGWSKISKYHGAACGGVTGVDVMRGGTPVAPVAADTIGAWAETFAAAMTAEKNESAAAAAEILLNNALPAAMAGGEFRDCQMVDSCGKNASVRRIYAAQDDILSAARLGSGWAAVASCAVMTEEKGISIQYLQEGEYAASGLILSVAKKSGCWTVTVQNADEKKAAISVRIPAWTDDTCDVQTDKTIRKENGYFRLEGSWKAGDTITCLFPETVRTAAGYHQSVTVWKGPCLQTAAVTEMNIAAAGDPVTENDTVILPVCETAEWDRNADGTVDLPVMPKGGEMKMLPMMNYADTVRGMAQFPRCRKA